MQGAQPPYSLMTNQLEQFFPKHCIPSSPTQTVNSWPHLTPFANHQFYPEKINEKKNKQTKNYHAEIITGLIKYLNLSEKEMKC